ncbi:inositol monophosphatase family protein [Thermophagus xiamenensis]|jgi:myo-inositol-1(or 4)-monophosphatase|uniref:Inositol-1-monophosphatase n=1 Tax=Thermophagus xiamenensis TaxID=385682 RepID=A0A1I2C8A3_9BACT|nr:inositol monophosphatase family protein [Thermophagus xiamenensis]SFE64566.1 myo-inositol-1(or 4)-monophosphatase [Thermophagus xiamenensis]
MVNYQKLCEKTVKIARETGSFVKNFRLNNTPNVETKGKNDFVTQIDKASEQKLVEALGNLLPEAGFIAEEKTSDKVGKKFNWIIDPIDGTTNFIHGLFPYAISIALQEDDQIVLGVVYEMGLDECFYSWKDAPAFLNGEEIHVSKTPTVADSLIATGFPYSNYQLIQNFMETLTFFMKNSHGLRRLGSAAVDLAYVACGRFDAFYEYNLKAWDVAAGAFLVQQAGGKVSDFKGGNNYLFGRELVSGNALMFEEMQQTIEKFMKKEKL